MSSFISPRQRMCQAIAERLRKIRTTDGFHTDAGLDVVLEPLPALAEDGRTFLVVLWSQQTRASDPAVIRTHQLTAFEVIARVPAAQGEAQQQLDAITADIERAMAAPGPPWPSGYTAPQYHEAKPMPTEFGSGYTGVGVTFHSHIPIH